MILFRHRLAQYVRVTTIRDYDVGAGTQGVLCPLQKDKPLCSNLGDLVPLHNAANANVLFRINIPNEVKAIAAFGQKRHLVKDQRFALISREHSLEDQRMREKHQATAFLFVGINDRRKFLFIDTMIMYRRGENIRDAIDIVRIDEQRGVDLVRNDHFRAERTQDRSYRALSAPDTARNRHAKHYFASFQFLPTATDTVSGTFNAITFSISRLKTSHAASASVSGQSKINSSCTCKINFADNPASFNPL